MQWILNLLYKLISSAFSLFDSISLPDFVVDLVTAITKYCVILNYYFPLGTLVSVGVTVIGITIILMIISGILKII